MIRRHVCDVPPICDAVRIPGHWVPWRTPLFTPDVVAGLWRCDCGRCWMIAPWPDGVLSRISAWRYRRAMRRRFFKVPVPTRHRRHEVTEEAGR